MGYSNLAFWAVPADLPGQDFLTLLSNLLGLCLRVSSHSEVHAAVSRDNLAQILAKTLHWYLSAIFRRALVPHFILQMCAKALEEADPRMGISHTGRGTSRLIVRGMASACWRSCLASEWETFECGKRIQHSQWPARKGCCQTVQRWESERHLSSFIKKRTRGNKQK